MPQPHQIAGLHTLFFALVPNSWIPEHARRADLSPDAWMLCSYGAMFSMTHAITNTYSNCLERSHARAAEMRALGIPHDAFALFWGADARYPGQGASRALSRIILSPPVPPDGPGDKELRGHVLACAEAGLIIQVYDTYPYMPYKQSNKQEMES